MTKFRILITGRNNKPWWRAAVESAQHQDYPRDSFHVDLVDDASTDGSQEEAMVWAPSTACEWNVELHANLRRRGAMANWYGLLHDPWWEDEVVVLMGSDDHLAHGNVLSTLDRLYRDPNVWMTYGNYKTTDGSPSVADPYVSGDFRREPFNFLHPCTFRSPLFRKVRREDLSMGSQWISSSEDVAVITPMMEMSGLDRIRRIDEVLYVYRVHPGNSGTSEKLVQDFCYWYVRQQAPFRRLSDLSVEPAKDQGRASHKSANGLFCIPQNLAGLQQRWRTSLEIPCTVDKDGNPHAHFLYPEKK